ncbi:MAG: SCO family protein [Pseudomonadota bacterium]
MKAHTRRPWRALAIAAVLAGATPAVASYNRPAPQDAFDPALLRVEEGRYLGQAVPNVLVSTESGPARLHALIAGQPTILLLAYYTCHGPCPTTVQNLARVLRTVRDPEHRVIVLSFDANDSLDGLRHVKSSLGQLPDGWTFGLLAREESARLTGSVGFSFFFSERDRTFVHPSVLVFLSPQGEVMRYLYGTEPRTQDIELALIETRNRVSRLNELVDMVKLTCYRFDPARSRYVLHPTLIFGGIGIGVLGVTGLIAFAYKRDSKGGQ